MSSEQLDLHEIGRQLKIPTEVITGILKQISDEAVYFVCEKNVDLELSIGVGLLCIKKDAIAEFKPFEFENAYEDKLAVS